MKWSGGDEAHGGGKSVAWCLCSHDAEAAYRSQDLRRIVWRAWPTPCPRLVVVRSAPTAAVVQLPKQSSHAHSRAPCAQRARPCPPEQPSPSPRPARRAPGTAGAAHRALRPPAHAAQPPHRRSEAPHQPPDRRCEEAEWPGRQLGGSAPAYHIHGGAPAPTSAGLAASSQSAQPRAALGGHAGVGGSGGRRGGGLANGLAVGDETRLGKGALSVRAVTTGLGGSSRGWLELQRIIIGGGRWPPLSVWPLHESTQEKEPQIREGPI